jgi:hypothetical protein
MNSGNMKKTIGIVILILILVNSYFGLSLNLTTSNTSNIAVASKKKGASGGITEEQATKIKADTDRLTKKIYANGLFSPSDNETLISIKMSLDSAMLLAPDPSFAPLYYNIGRIYAKRDMKDEAVECFQTILENFGDTALGPKSRLELEKMGVTIKLPTMPSDSAE